MQWSTKTLENQKNAALHLEQILYAALDYLAGNVGNVTEYEASRFIQTEFADKGLISDKNPPIVAFRQSTSLVHYFPEPDEAKVLEHDSLVMIDLWARLSIRNSPYADITWMAYVGKKIPEKIQDRFKIVKEARNCAIDYIKRSLENNKMPGGKAIDDLVRRVLEKHQVLKNFPHTTGHSLGFHSPHGKLPGISQRNSGLLYENIVYTLEPGIYFPSDFGIRLELDFYINDQRELIITTPVQEEIEII